MFLAAGPYFARRFHSNNRILANFQAAELSVSTVASLGSMLVLTKLQTSASYPRRIFLSLLINIFTFSLLAIFTKAFLMMPAVTYFTFLIVMVFATSLATGLMQNGALAYVSGFGMPVYMQAIMTGQGIAGVLPPIVQIISVLSAPIANKVTAKEDTALESSTSAMAYFITATGVSVLALLAFFYLAIHHRPQPTTAYINNSVAEAGDSDEDSVTRLHDVITGSPKAVPMHYLANRLRYSAAAIFLTFAITMLFPVITQRILSTNPHPSALFRQAAFVPLAFLVWNTGDLLGRIIPLSRRLSLIAHPKILLLCSILRVVFIPLYLLCNIQPIDPFPEASSVALATVQSDAFYLLVVQFPFGLSNGYLSSCCMMGAGSFVNEEEREAAGGFMGLVLVAGLAVGSFCSFFASSGG